MPVASISCWCGHGFRPRTHSSTFMATHDACSARWASNSASLAGLAVGWPCHGLHTAGYNHRPCAALVEYLVNLSSGRTGISRVRGMIICVCGRKSDVLVRPVTPEMVRPGLSAEARLFRLFNQRRSQNYWAHSMGP